MKILIVLAFLFTAFQGHAQSTASVEDDLLKAYQREYAFLAAQNESLKAQARKVADQQRKKLQEAQTAIRQLEARVVASQSESDQLFEEVQLLERRRKDEIARESTIQNLWKRMKKSIAENRLALEFSSDAVVEEPPHDSVKIADLVTLSQEALAVLRQSGSPAQITNAYLNENDELVEGKVLRVGRVAAFSLNDDGYGLLGPGRDGHLKRIEKIQTPSVDASLVPLYAFESLKEKVKLKKPAGWVEKLADISPILFLGILFMMVGWLFAKLARI